MPFPHRADIYIRRHALLKKDDLVSCYEMVKSTVEKGGCFMIRRISDRNDIDCKALSETYLGKKKCSAILKLMERITISAVFM